MQTAPVKDGKTQEGAAFRNLENKSAGTEAWTEKEEIQNQCESTERCKEKGNYQEINTLTVEQTEEI